MDTVRKRYVIGNWKMNKTASEAEAFLAEAGEGLVGVNDVAFGVAPGFLALPAAVRAAKPPLLVVAQDAHDQPHGAFTGAVSFAQLKDAGVKWALVGHSERRTLFGETDQTVAAKVRALLANGMVPVLCVGETLKEFESNQTEDVLARQITAAIQNLAPADVPKLVVAYEPVWAIGTGKVATPDQAQKAIGFIRGKVAGCQGPQAARDVSILYGGSVKPDNIAELLSRPDIDGALVGGASLAVDQFVALVKNAQKAARG